MSDHLGQRLAELPVPPSADARERTVAAARAATPAAARPRRRRALLAGAVCVLGLSFLTPPGQAAIEKVGELVGIGDVGDEPTLAPRHDSLNRGVIVDNGHAPDGTGYEWTAYRADNRYEIDGKDVRVDEFCVGFDWPDVAARGRPAGCSSVDDSPDDPSDIEYLAAWSNQWLQDRAEGVRRRDVMLWGMTTHEPRDVRIRYTDAQGRGHDVPVDFRRVQGELLRRAGGARPFGVFVGFIGAEQAARDLRSRYPDLSLIVPRAPGPLQAEWLPEVCKSDADHGPFEYRFYGSDGKLLDRVRTIVLHPASQPCIDAMQELDDSGFVPPEEP